MTKAPLPETHLGADLKHDIDTTAGTFRSVSDAEAAALAGDIAKPLLHNQRWIDFCNLVNATIDRVGYIVVRGLEPDEGRSLLVASSALGIAFDSYHPGQIVKRFRMSPWTNELSHTIRAGDFHTDGNISAVPPLATAMQCEQEDPGAPEFAEQRVAYLPDLLARLGSGDSRDATALAFLTEREAAMAHERSQNLWRGRLVHDGTIRYHPHSLRIAQKRLGGQPADLEEMIGTIHNAALDVSVPFHTRPGDTVLVSNRTALHYRGACSVRFTRFPTEFESRSLFVLHLKKDP